MVGGGTAALIAVSEGRDAVVGDIDPLACLVTRAKTTPIEPDELRALFSLILDQVGSVGYNSKVALSLDEAVMQLEDETPFRAPPRVLHWFHPTVARDLARILLACHDILRRRPQAERDAVLAVVAGTIRRISRADPVPLSGLEVTAVRKKKLSGGLRFDLLEELFNRMELLAQGYRSLLELPNLGAARVFQIDARKWAKLCRARGLSPSLHLVSPPYLNAIEYWRRHRLEFFWLGLVQKDDYHALSHRFIGTKVVRPSVRIKQEDGLPAALIDVRRSLQRLGFDHDAQVTEQYFLDTLSWLRELSEVLSENDGDAYVVVGPSYKRGVRIDTPALVVGIANQVGLRAVKVSFHSVVNRRMQFPLRNGEGIRTEAVIRLRPA